MKIKVCLELHGCNTEIVLEEQELDRLPTVIFKMEDMLDALFPSMENTSTSNDALVVDGTVSVTFLPDGRKVLRVKTNSAPKYGLPLYPDTPGYEKVAEYLDKPPGDYDTVSVIPGSKKILKVIEVRK